MGNLRIKSVGKKHIEKERQMMIKGFNIIGNTIKKKKEKKK